MREVRWRSTKPAAWARVLHAMNPTRRRLAHGPITVPPTRSAGKSAAADARAVCGRLDADFVPISDHRVSALYRLTAANALLHKTPAEIAGTPSYETRVTGRKEWTNCMGWHRTHCDCHRTDAAPHHGDTSSTRGAELNRAAATGRGTTVPKATPLRVVGVPTSHDSAVCHVAGSAAYVDDLREPAGTLYVAVGGATPARGVVACIDLAARRQSTFSRIDIGCMRRILVCLIPP
jgi:hypothetical protein